MFIKKGIAFSLMLVLLLCLTAMVPAGAAFAAESTAGTTIVYGDYNNDQSVDALDFVGFKQYLMDTNRSFKACLDLNLDNTVDAIDFAIMKQYLLRIITTLPYGESKPGVLLIGRFDNSDPAGPKFAWSDTTIKANFQGTGISVKLSSAGDNWFNVIIDGVVKSPINTTSGSSSVYTLASGLTNGNHTVELVRRTECWVGDVQFLGFTVTGGNLLAPPAPSSKRIEFIGDSITCGYGNEGTSQYQSFTTKNENAYLAYGAVTARLLGADPITVCWSGKGVVQNYGGDTANDLMPAIYPQVLPYNKTLTWDTSKWIPQVVVINLGTNDFSTNPPNTTAFTAAYEKFVNRIRGQYPNAHIYCSIGPMLGGDQLKNCKNCITSVVNKKNSAGDQKIHFIEFPAQDQANGLGEDWHPSVKTHQLMADQLAAQIRKDLGW